LSGADFTKAEKGRKETAINKLPELIQQLADKISMEDEETQTAILAILAKKFASVGYTSLTKKIAAAVGANVPQSVSQVQEPEIDDLGSEEEEPEPNDELNEISTSILLYALSNAQTMLQSNRAKANLQLYKPKVAFRVAIARCQNYYLPSIRPILII
jgi:hypothetical protein